MQNKASFLFFMNKTFIANLHNNIYEKSKKITQLTQIKNDLNNNGYKVNIRGPFYGLDVYWEIRVSWEE